MLSGIARSHCNAGPAPLVGRRRGRIPNQRLADRTFRQDVPLIAVISRKISYRAIQNIRIPRTTTAAITRSKVPMSKPYEAPRPELLTARS